MLELHEYYYGDGTEHIVRMSAGAAETVNKFKYLPRDLMIKYYGNELQYYYLTLEECKLYTEGVTSIQRYLYHTDTPLSYDNQSQPLLRLKE